MALKDGRAMGRQPLRDGREFEIGAGHAIPQFKQHFGETGHADAADADKMNVLGFKKHFNRICFGFQS